MRLLIATPFRAAELPAATCSLGYTMALLRLGWDLKDELSVHTTFSLDVCRARNQFVGDLLSQPGLASVTHVLFWDDDNWPEDVRVIREMVALTAHAAIVGAPYTNKRAPVKWTHQGIPGAVEDERGLLEVRGVPLGFTLITRACLEQMAAHHRTRWYISDKGIRCPDLFGQLYDDLGGRTTLLSEDFSFCKRWREDNGGKVYVYTRAGLVYHAGPHAWSARDMVGGIVG